VAEMAEAEKLTSEIMDNPCRVLPAQERFISGLAGSRYVPVMPWRKSGIIVLRDTKPDEPEEWLQLSPTSDEGAKPGEEEPSPPAPFEFIE